MRPRFHQTLTTDLISGTRIDQKFRSVITYQVVHQIQARQCLTGVIELMLCYQTHLIDFQSFHQTPRSFVTYLVIP